MTYLSKTTALSLLVKHSHLYQTRYIKIDHNKYCEFFGNQDQVLVEKLLEELVAEKLVSRIVTASSSIITVLEEGHKVCELTEQTKETPPKEILEIQKMVDAVAEIADKLTPGKKYYHDLEQLEGALDRLKLLLESARESDTVLSR